MCLGLAYGGGVDEDHGCPIASGSREAAEREGLPAAELGPSPGFRDLVWRKPVYVGDTVTYHSQVTDKRASRSRPGWDSSSHRNTGVNSDGETVFSFDGCRLLAVPPLSLRGAAAERLRCASAWARPCADVPVPASGPDGEMDQGP